MTDQLFVVPAARGRLGAGNGFAVAELGLGGPGGEHRRVYRKRQFTEVLVLQRFFSCNPYSRVVREEPETEKESN